MLIDFTISNFRSIKDPQTISFEATDDTHLEEYYVVNKGGFRLLKMATIIGANASGKSNMLQAYMLFLLLMRVPCESKTDRILYDRFAFDNESAAQDSTIGVNFICAGFHYRYHIVFNNELVFEENLQRRELGSSELKLIFVRRTDRITKHSVVSLEDDYLKYQKEFEDLQRNLLHNRTVFGAYQKTNVDIPWMKEVADWMVSYLLPIVTTAEQGLPQYTSNQIFAGKISKEQVAAFLRKADVGIDDFSVKNEDIPISVEYASALLADSRVDVSVKEQVKNKTAISTARVKMMHQGNKGHYELDFKEESRGTQRYYEMAGVLLTLINSSHIVAIDELEYAMHPDLYEHFMATFLTNAKESQIICTTHMREFLTDRNLFRDDSVWIAQKDSCGASEFYSMADFDKKELQQIGSRYNAYKSGRLGGVPLLGDTYVEPHKLQEL